jgi:hypothetical protein
LEALPLELELGKLLALFQNYVNFWASTLKFSLFEIIRAGIAQSV